MLGGSPKDCDDEPEECLLLAGPMLVRSFRDGEKDGREVLSLGVLLLNLRANCRLVAVALSLIVFEEEEGLKLIESARTFGLQSAILGCVRGFHKVAIACTPNKVIDALKSSLRDQFGTSSKFSARLGKDC